MQVVHICDWWVNSVFDVGVAIASSLPRVSSRSVPENQSLRSLVFASSKSNNDFACTNFGILCTSSGRSHRRISYQYSKLQDAGVFLIDNATVSGMFEKVATAAPFHGDLGAAQVTILDQAGAAGAVVLLLNGNLWYLKQLNRSGC